jgi:hypothetical protein
VDIRQVKPTLGRESPIMYQKGKPPPEITVPEVCTELLAKCPQGLPNLCKAVRCQFILWHNWGLEVQARINELRKAVAELEKQAHGEGPADPSARISGVGGTLDQPDVGDPPDPPWGNG